MDISLKTVAAQTSRLSREKRVHRIETLDQQVGGYLIQPRNKYFLKSRFFIVDKKPITFTTVEGDAGAKLDKIFQVKSSFLRVQPSDCLLPPHFVFYGSRIRDMEVYEDDVWMVSYPRTGEYICHLIRFIQGYPSNMYSNIFLLYWRIAGSHWAQEMVWCIGNDFDYENAQTLLIVRNPLLE